VQNILSPVKNNPSSLQEREKERERERERREEREEKSERQKWTRRGGGGKAGEEARERGRKGLNSRIGRPQADLS